MGERYGSVGACPGPARPPAPWHRYLLVLLSCLASLVASPLQAQQDPQRKAAAEVLFSEGQKLLFDGDHAAACHRFEQSQALDPGVGTLLYLGECYERLGRAASAWAIYREAESAAQAAGQFERSGIAHERASRLEPTLAKLTVQVPPENARDGYEVTLNGKVIDRSLYGVPFPLDPGRYELVARGLGRTPWSSRFDIQPAQQHSVPIPALELASGAEPPSAAEGSTPAPASGSNGKPTDNALTPMRKAGIIVAASGAVALTAGLVLGVIAKHKDDESQACPDPCVQVADAEALNDEAQGYATAANIGYFVGGLALVTGGVLYFWPQKSTSASAGRSSLGISARIGPTGGLLTIGGVL